MLFFFRSKSQERLGEILILITAFFTALSPILVHYGVQKIPPIFFAAATLLMAGFSMAVWLMLAGRFNELKKREAWFPMVMVTFCIAVFPSLLFYTGTRLTSGINTAILLTAEIFFALLFFHFVGERVTRAKVAGGIAMAAGTALVVWNGQLTLNRGDLLILLATAFYPFGNFYAKKVLNLVNPLTLVFVRTFLGGLILLGFSRALEPLSMTDLAQLWKDFWWLLLLNGLLIAAVSKVIWYEGLKRVEVGKATVIVMSYPALSMILATIFLKEIPTSYQFGGLLIIFAGLYSILYYQPLKKSDAQEVLFR